MVEALNNACSAPVIETNDWLCVYMTLCMTELSNRVVLLLDNRLQLCIVYF